MTFATISCIAVLENLRKIDLSKPNTTALDGQVFLNGSLPSLICFFCYYNATDIQFETEAPEAYMVWAKVAKIQNQVELHQEGLKYNKHHLMGNIISLARLGPAKAVELRHHAVLHMIRIAWNVNKQDFTFDLHAKQWVSALGTNSVFPTKVHIPDIGRFKQNKPYWSNNSRCQAYNLIYVRKGEVVLGVQTKKWYLNPGHKVLHVLIGVSSSTKNKVQVQIRQVFKLNKTKLRQKVAEGKTLQVIN
ncbi:hypothetical protein C8J57DRAFT_1220910 [Mycena rebaudengoi]|nr:hypothetical protein C8J57DRAFT_1220910 [Mycena rebaudengoi]